MQKSKTAAKAGTAGKSAPKKRFVIGIDTGGTYTDGVLLDYTTREVVRSAKTLTTRDDLARGIATVLDGLKIEKPQTVRLVGISSTLATNSIAENKVRPTGLALIGYDRDLVESYDLGGKFSTPLFDYFRGGHDPQGKQKEKLDLESVLAWVRNNRHKMEALAVSSYFSPLNPAHEKAVYKAVRKEFGLPIVLGHQLSTKIDSIKRATTACLNASLVAVMSEFMEAVRSALASHGVKAPLMVVKGDGTLMPYKEAIKRPVETVLSGPAASAIGGRFLTNIEDAVMIDVGGTTTDIALVKGGHAELYDEGARVGDIQTAVRAAGIRTACLGCDSRIAPVQGGGVSAGPDRVVPLSRLASLHPRVEQEILGLKKKRSTYWVNTDLEYWWLHRPVDPEDLPPDNIPQRRLVEILKDGPVCLTKILKLAKVHHQVQLNTYDLSRRGLIEAATLTPTDLLHAEGKMELWSAEAAKQAVKCFCKINGHDPKTFSNETLGQVIAGMTEETVVFLARWRPGREDNQLPERIDEEWGRWLFERSLVKDDHLVSVDIGCRHPLIGIGAPAECFLEKVAEILGTKFVLPPSHEVANAVGAVAGSIMVTKEAIMYVQETADTRTYEVQIEGESRSFEQADEAGKFAEETVSEMALQSATEAGAISPEVELKTSTEGSLKRYRASAVGNPRFTRPRKKNEAAKVARANSIV